MDDFYSIYKDDFPGNGGKEKRIYDLNELKLFKKNFNI
jgi:hypothetical protein